MTKGLISAIMPVFNSEPYLKNPLYSLLIQSYKNFELIVIDDGSTDNSMEILKEFIKKKPGFKIKIFRNYKNMGQAFSLNKGIRQATGTYICFIDSDDKVSPEFFFLLKKEMHKNSHDFVYCGFDMIDTTTGKVVKYESNRKYLEDSKTIIEHYMSARNHFAFVGAIYRKAFINANHIRFNENNKCGCDIEFICDLFLKNPKCGCVSQSLYFYLRRRGSLSTDNQCPNIFHSVEAMERIQKKVPGFGRKLKFATSRKTNMVFHVITKLYDNKAKKKVPLLTKIYYMQHFILEIVKNPRKRMTKRNLSALAYFLEG